MRGSPRLRGSLGRRPVSRRRTVGAGPVLLSVLFTIAGCSLAGCDARAASPEPARIDTLGGVVHVWNPPQGAWGDGTGWSVQEVLRLGGTWGPEEQLFSGPLLTTSIGPDGLLYVLDSNAAVLSVFDSTGALVRTTGRPGRGPGEFVSPSAMVFDGLNRLWVADGFGGRYTVFDEEGELIRTQARPVRALARLQHPISYLKTGSLLDEASSWPRVLFLRVDTSGARVDTLGSLRQPELSDAAMAVRIPPGSDFQKVVQNMQLRRHWAVGPDGTLWTADSGELLLVQRTFGGDTIRVVHTSHRKLEFSSSENRMISRGLDEVGLGPEDITVVRPVLQSLHVLEDGHVLVQIESDIGEAGRTFDVFEPEGRFLGSLDLPFAPAPLGVAMFRGDTILAPTLGDNDVPFVVEAVIRRGTSRD